MTNRIVEKLTETVTSSDRAAEMGENMNQATDAGLQYLDVTRRSVEQYVASHPIICLGAALATGMAVGWWVKRK
jgi:ElaB/YqjD/DUF883 family membrane-anchored ribosome-binding protein